MLLGPGLLRAGGGIPGAPRSDLWNSLWSLWHAVEVRSSFTSLLDHPDGGVLLVADPLNALLLAPLTVIFGAAIAWTVGVVAHLWLAAAAADALASDLGADESGALVAGVAYASAPLLLSSVHNGTSESVSAGLLPLALLALRWAMRTPRPYRLGLGALALAAAGWASPYLAVVTWIAAAFMIVIAPSGARGPGVVVLTIATAAVLPWAFVVQRSVASADSLVGIKDAHEVALVRRTIGGADPLAFVAPGDFRSPDFRRISRYGEDFRHVPYLGWIWLAGAIAGARRAPWLIATGIVCAALACGPVLVHAGAPVLLPGNLGVPLPYFLVERLPGFVSLSLVYRLAIGASLAVAVLAGLAPMGAWGRWIAVAGLAEVLLLSPMRGGPDASRLPPAGPFEVIARGPDGAVMSWPLEGGRAYLYEATLHGRPVAATLNFPSNDAARRVWDALRDDPAGDPLVAVRLGVRWLVVHDDPAAAPGPYDAAVLALEARREPEAAGEGVRVYRLW